MTNKNTLETLEKHLADIENTIKSNSEIVLLNLKQSIGDENIYRKLLETFATYDRQLLNLTIAIAEDIRKLKESKKMTIKSDKWIKEQITYSEGSMILPFFDRSIKTNRFNEKIPSYGLSSYGYDIRLGRNFKIFKDKVIEEEISSKGDIILFKSLNPTNIIFFENNKRIEGDKVVSDMHSLEYKNTRLDYIDVCNFDDECLVELDDVDSIIIPPHSFVLGHSEEHVTMPRDVTAVCMGKSTIARAGIIVTVTPIECGWSGFITLEITNTTGIPVKLQTGIGITQLQFFQSDEQCEISYGDRAGKYQDQPKKPVSATN